MTTPLTTPLTWLQDHGITFLWDHIYNPSDTWPFYGYEVDLGLDGYHPDLPTRLGRPDLTNLVGIPNGPKVQYFVTSPVHAAIVAGDMAEAEDGLARAMLIDGRAALQGMTGEQWAVLRCPKDFEALNDATKRRWSYNRWEWAKGCVESLDIMLGADPIRSRLDQIGVWSAACPK